MFCSFRARVLTWGLFVGAAAAVLAPVGPGAFVPLKLAVAAADSVGNDVYVAVVVDFGNGSSLTSIAKCVPVPSTGNDADALAAAVGQANVAYASSGLLCSIDNYPGGVQSCGQSVGSGDYDYWSYWHGASGSWVYANNGPAEQSVSSPSNDVEGWRFQIGQPDNSSDPPPAVAASYAQICNASTEVPPSQQPPPAVTTTTTPPATSPSPAVTPTTGVRTSGGPHQATTATSTTQPKPGPAAKAPGPGTTTTTSGSRTPAGTGSDRHATTSTQPTALAAAPSHHAGGGGTPFLPVILVAAAVAALGGVAFFRWRRRPAEE